MSISSMPSGNRKIAIAVDLSDESAYAVRWAVANYLRSDDSVILLHVQPTGVLYGADWGAMEQSMDSSDDESHEQSEENLDALTSSKAADLATPILNAGISYKIHIVKDHDLKERLCLEVERLGVNAVIMGSRGFGASRKTPKARLGSVSDYCVHHCDCPVVVVRYPEEKEGDGGPGSLGKLPEGKEGEEHLYDMHMVTSQEMNSAREKEASPVVVEKVSAAAQENLVGPFTV